MNRIEAERLVSGFNEAAAAAAENRGVSAGLNYETYASMRPRPRPRKTVGAEGRCTPGGHCFNEAAAAAAENHADHPRDHRRSEGFNEAAAAAAENRPLCGGAPSRDPWLQ